MYIYSLLFSDRNETSPVLSASKLLERRHIFHANLVSIVKQHHKVSRSYTLLPFKFPLVVVTASHMQETGSRLKLSHIMYCSGTVIVVFHLQQSHHKA